MSSEAAVEMQGGKWKRYPAYRDSGVEWIGEVPEHWMAKRLKYITTANDETLSETTDPDFELVYVDIGSIDPISGIRNKETMTFENAPSRARRKVRNGDVIISTVRTYLRAISPVNNPESNMVVSTGFAVIRPKENIESQFAAYALRAPYFVDKVVANSVGVSYPAINASELINFNIALPPLPEQHAIAAFLDRETGRIDTLIEKKERQVELLQEKRAALISHTVTKGLDPDVTMKDSGVEWLGEVPDEWSSTAVKHHFDIQLGKMLQNKPDSVEDILVPYAKALHVLWGNVLTDDLTEMWAHPSDIQQYGIEAGDLLVCEGGEVGRTGIVTSQPKQCIIQNALHRVRAKKSNELRFLQYILYAVSSSTWLDVLCNKATIAHFTREKFADLRIPVPPHSEQRAIATFLDRETGRIDTLTTKIQESTIKLREYRTALISAAVTGKIDVRQEVMT